MSRKPFTAELQLSRSRGGQPEASPSLADIHALLLEMRQDMRIAAVAGSHNAVPPIPPAPEQSGDPAPSDTPPEEKRGEITLLKTELRALSFCIEQTKSEIAALRPPSENLDRLATVTSELDAIVMATETATQQILEAAERLENCARDMRAQMGDSYGSRIAEDMLDITTSIFEACNFQDITGQRISKAVKTLQFIDERIGSMVTIWGGDDGLNGCLPDHVQDNRRGDELLLNGPQTGEGGISQDEIDRLFASG